MSRLFFSNIPYDCPDAELRQWVESHGFRVDTVRVVRDLVTGVSPAFGYISLQDDVAPQAIHAMNRQTLRGRTLQVKEDWRSQRISNFPS